MRHVIRNAPLAVKLSFAFGWGVALALDVTLFLVVALMAGLTYVVADVAASVLNYDLSDFWEPLPPLTDPDHTTPEEH